MHQFYHKNCLNANSEKKFTKKTCVNAKSVILYEHELADKQENIRKEGERLVKRNLILAKATALDMQVSDLANAIGIHPSTMSQKLNGKTEFTVGEADALKNVLKLTNDEVSDIFFG